MFHPSLEPSVGPSPLLQRKQDVYAKSLGPLPASAISGRATIGYLASPIRPSWRLGASAYWTRY